MNNMPTLSSAMPALKGDEIDAHVHHCMALRRQYAAGELEQPEQPRDIVRRTHSTTENP